jgi:aldehyde oxidoreductase
MADLISVHLTVNGTRHTANVPADLSLMEYLRNELHLTGAKNGCEHGHCGTCTVILNGKAVRSCIVKMRMPQAQKAVVETIENLARNGKIHPLQYAFLEEGAVQCGFCTPGMIMASKALLDRTPSPSDSQIVSALDHNLCRCTGYAGIIRAVRRAAGLMADGQILIDPPTESSGKTSWVGASVRRKDGLAKVTGSMMYADDLRMDGMLHGKVLWADRPHAEILSIDTSRAESSDSVRVVLTAADVPGVNRLGLLRRDQPAIARDNVRFIGDPVAAVFADTEQAAEGALKMIHVEYRDLPGVFTAEQAASADAPKIHETGNLCHQARLARGDVEEAFRQAAVVVEETYTTPFVEHAFLEPESGIAYPDGEGGVVIKIGTQCAFDDRDQLAEALALAPEKVRVVQLPMGGAFGGKEDIILHFILALGALKSGCPVKITLTRDESLRTHPKRHPARMHYKTAASADGRLMAVQSHVVLDTGAYTSLGSDVLENTLTFGAGPYYVPNLYMEAEAYFTNNIPAGAMRGFGVPQVTYAMESQVDALARALGMDPFEFRLKNALDVGLPLASDHVMESSVGIKATLEAAREALQKHMPKSSDKKLGVGVACGLKNVGFGHGSVEDAGAIVELDEEGGCHVKVGVAEFGQGSLSALAQIAAQELGFPYDRIEILGSDTLLTPQTGPTTASRQTYLTGNAVVAACRELKAKIFQIAADELRASPDEFELQAGEIVHTPSGRRLSIDKLGAGLSAEERYQAPATAPFKEVPGSSNGGALQSLRTHWAYSFVTHVAIVEVDPATGDVRVVKFIAAHDVGRAINPRLIEGQIEGGVMMGIGYGLSEEFVVEDGVNLTSNLLQCRIPKIKDQPEIIPLIVEDPVPEGPFGAKGVGEASVLPTAAAVVNAIYDAVGARILSLPATKLRVREAIEKASLLS